jgi:hypothetical protein
MDYVQYYEINGIVSKQVACIELQGKPNAATVGAVGLLGMDMLSPTRDVYKCVAVNGGIYTWELLSSGMSTLTSSITGNGESPIQFPRGTLKTPSGYMVKNGDLIIDASGYLYQVESLGVDAVGAVYCGTQFLKGEKGEQGLTPYIKDGHWWIGDTDTGTPVDTIVEIEHGSYVGTGTYGANNPTSLTFPFTPKLVIVDDVILINPMSQFVVSFGSYNGINRTTWLENGISWYTLGGDDRYGGADYQLNSNGDTYHYVAIG